MVVGAVASGGAREVTVWSRASVRRVAVLVAAALLASLVVVTPAAAAAPGVQGTVRDAAGDPIAEVTITAEPVEGGPAAGPVATDAEGRFALGLAPGTYELHATPPPANPTGLLPATVIAHVEADRAITRHIILPAANVRGTAFNADGSPASGAVVSLRHPYSGELVTDDEGIKAPNPTTAAADGSFALRAPVGEYAVWVEPDRASAPGPAGGAVPVTIPSVDGEPGEVTGVSVSLQDANVSGAVLDPDGMPVAGARLAVEDDPAVQYDRPRHLGSDAVTLVSTRADGTFRLRLPPGATYTFVASVPGTTTGWGAGRSSAAVADGPVTGVEVRLAAPNTSGVVLDPDGNPVAGAEVTIYGFSIDPANPNGGQGPFVHERLTSRADGTWSTYVPEGNKDWWGQYYGYTMQAALPLGSQQLLAADERHAVGPGGAIGIELDLLAPTIAGTVRDPFTGDPLTGLTVTVVDDAGEEWTSSDLTHRGSSSSDLAGRYGLRVPAGDYRVVVHASGGKDRWIRRSIPVTVPPTGATSLDVSPRVAPANPLSVLPAERPTVGSLSLSEVDEAATSTDGSAHLFRGRFRHLGFCGEGCADEDVAWFVEPSAGLVERVDVAVDGSEREGSVSAIALAGDATAAFFVSDDDGLAPGDDNWSGDLYRRDLVGGTTERLTTMSTDPWEYLVGPISTTADGGLVAMTVGGSHPDTRDRQFRVDILDVTTGHIRSTPTGPALMHPTLSADGSTLAYIERVSVGVTHSLVVRVVDLAQPDLDPDASFTAHTHPYLEWEDGTDFGQWPGPSLSADGAKVSYVAIDMRRDSNGYDYLHGTAHVADTAAGGADLAMPSALGEFTSAEGVHRARLAPAADALYVTAAVSDWDDDAQNANQLWRHDVATGDTGLVSQASDARSFHRGVDTFAPSAAGVAFGGVGGAFHGLPVESDPPTWPAGASITLTDIGATSATASWPAATDVSGIAGYRVFVDGVQVAEKGAGTRTHRLAGLTPSTSYTVKVDAIDGAGNISADGPSAAFQTIAGGADVLVPLVAASGGGGSTVDLTWDAVVEQDVTELVVARGVGDEPLQELVRLPATATTHTDAGVPAGAPLRYQILKVRGASPAAHTVVASLASPPLTITSAAASLAGAGSAAPLGESLAVTARASRSRQAAASVQLLHWYDADANLLAEPRSVIVVVPMVELAAAPGQYSGTLLLEEGVARVAGAEVVVGDGHGSEVRQATSLPPTDVAGAIRVDIAGGADLAGHLATVTSDSTGVAGRRRLETGDAVARFPFAPAATDYVVELADPTTWIAFRTEGVSTRAGLTTVVTAVPASRADLTVGLTGPDGSSVTGMAVQVVDDSSGRLVGSATANPAAAIRGLRAGQRVRVSPVLPFDSSYLPVSRTVTLTAGGNAVDIGLTTPPRGVARGVVQQDGRPLGGAAVSLTSHVDGRPRTNVTTTGPDGSFAVEGFEGPAQVRVAHGPSAAPVRAIELTASLDLGVIEMPVPTPRVALVDFRTRYSAEDAWQKVSMDLITAIHFHAAARIVNPSTGWARSGWFEYAPDEPDPNDGNVAGLSKVRVLAAPGDTLEVCVRGFEAGLGSACDRVVFGDDNTPTVTLRLGPAPRVVMVARTAQGTPVAYTGALSRIEPDGSLTTVNLLRGSGEIVRTLPGEGRYQIDIHSEQGSGTRAFTVSGTGSAEGTIVVGANRAFTSSHNKLTATRSHVVPGGLAPFRATLRNDSPNVVAGATFEITSPAASHVLPESWVVDGVATAASTHERTAVVPLGDIGPGETRTVVWSIRVDEGFRGADLVLDGIVAGAGGLRDRISGPGAMVGPITLHVPRQLDRLFTVAKGQAPSGATVEVWTDNVLLGSGTAGPGGHWQADITLPATVLSQRFTLTARTTIDGVVHESSAAGIELDVDRPLPASVTVSQGGHGFRSVTVDPRAGVSRFPFVYRPGAALNVSATFPADKPVAGGQIRLGSTTKTVSAGGTFGASFTNEPPGSIDMATTAAPGAFSVPPVPAAGDGAALQSALRRLPARFRSATAHHEGGGSTKFTLTLPEEGGRELSFHVIARQVDSYTTTAFDDEVQAATGVPAYGLESAADLDGARVLVPEAALGGAGAGGAGGAGARAPRITVGKLIEYTFIGLSSLYDGKQGWDSDGKYKDLTRLVDMAVDKCPPGNALFYRDMADIIARQAFKFDVLSGALNIAGAVAAASGVGAVGGAAIWAGGALIGLATDRYIGNQVKDLERQILEDPMCDPTSPLRQVVDPVWIYDPSGNVYEGVWSNPVADVTATLLVGDSEHGPWRVADMTPYGQTNPLTTDTAGYYGWDVPEGWWKVRWTKDGYEPQESRALKVLPPHLDVHADLQRTGLPNAEGARYVAGGAGAMELGFDRYMKVDSVLGRLVLRRAGVDVPVVVSAVGAEDSPAGVPLARTFRLVTADGSTLAPGTYTVHVGDEVQAHTGRMPYEDQQREVVVPEAAEPGSPADLPAAAPGYRLVGADGGVFTFGAAPFAGSAAGLGLRSPVVGSASDTAGSGYWLVTADGGVFAYGGAPDHGGLSGNHLNSPIVGIAAAPGGGYWLVAADGGVFAFGPARFAGGLGDVRLNSPIVGAAAAPGGGYWLAAADGGVFAFGGAPFVGSLGDLRLNSPIVGMAGGRKGSGYWLVAADGGVFAFGGAPFGGSLGNLRLNSPIAGMRPAPGGGYWLVAREGGVFALGGAPFVGSLGGIRLNAPVVAIG